MENFAEIAEKFPNARLVVDDEALIRWAIAATLADADDVVLEAGREGRCVSSVRNA